MIYTLAIRDSSAANIVWELASGGRLGAVVVLEMYTEEGFNLDIEARSQGAAEAACIACNLAAGREICRVLRSRASADATVFSYNVVANVPSGSIA